MKTAVFVFSLVVLLGLLLWFFPGSREGAADPTDTGIDTPVEAPLTAPDLGEGAAPASPSRVERRERSDEPDRAAGAAGFVLAGRVLAAETKRPISGCRVWLDGKASADALRVFTRSHGPVVWSGPRLALPVRLSAPALPKTSRNRM